MLNVQNRHPKANRPLIDLDMALFLAPMEMSGALVGVMIQKMLPVWLVILIMATVLGYTAWKTTLKGLETRRKEKAGLPTSPSHGNSGKAELFPKPKAVAVEVQAEGEHKVADDEAEAVSAEDVDVEGVNGIRQLSKLSRENLEKLEASKSEEGKGESVAPNPGQSQGAGSVYSGPAGSIYSSEEWLEKDAAFPKKKYFD